MPSKRIKKDPAQEVQFLYFQEVMRTMQALMSASEWSVFCFIYDRTWGWSKVWDRISYSQFTNGIVDSNGVWWHRGTGLSRSSVLRALKSLEAQGLIESKIAGSGKAWAIKRQLSPPGLFVSPYERNTT